MNKKLLLCVFMTSLLFLGGLQLATAQASDNGHMQSESVMASSGNEEHYRFYATSAKVNQVGELVVTCSGSRYRIGDMTIYHTIRVISCGLRL